MVCVCVLSAFSMAVPFVQDWDLVQTLGEGAYGEYETSFIIDSHGLHHLFSLESSAYLSALTNPRNVQLVSEDNRHKSIETYFYRIITGLSCRVLNLLSHKFNYEKIKSGKVYVSAPLHLHTLMCDNSLNIK